MRKLIGIFSSAALLGALILPASVAAGPPNQGQNWGKYVNASACSGTLVIDITYGVTNDADSGTTGNYWAYDNYRKQVQVWQAAAGSFCVIARYEGRFTPVATTSPGGTGQLAEGQTGTFAGGYQANFAGTLAQTPAYPTNGYLGSFDFGWTGDPTTPAPEPFDWVRAYFTTVDWSSWTDGFWGWVYQGGPCGTWYNTSLGTSGDIVC